MRPIESAFRYARTLRGLHPLQVLARPAHVVGQHVIRAVPIAGSPSLRAFARHNAGLELFMQAQAKRSLDRRTRLPKASLLHAFENAYGYEIFTEPKIAAELWQTRAAISAFPSSIRARQLAVAARLGMRGVAPELARACRAVSLQLEWHLLGNHLLENAIALCCGGAVATGWEADAWFSLGSALLDWQLQEQFLSDGAHFELCPSYHLSITAALLQVLELTHGSGRKEPLSLVPVVARALAWIDRIQAPDQSYPLFGDSSFDAAPSISEVFDLAQACGVNVPSTPSSNAFHAKLLDATGWLKLTSPHAWLMADAGPDGASYQPGHAHADALTFELWVHGERIVVDYGVASYQDDHARAQTRSTRVHNTVELAGQDSSEVWSAFRVGRRTQGQVHALGHTAQKAFAELSHDGYRWRKGTPVHHRRMELGLRELVIHDAMVGGSEPYVSRLRLDHAKSHTVKVSCLNRPLATHCDVWHANFAEPQKAVVFEAAANDDRGITWRLEF